MNNLWINNIPEDWQIMPLVRLLVRNDGGVWGDDSLDGSGTKVLRSTEITHDGKWLIEEPAIRKLTSQDLHTGLLKEGDLLLTKSSGSFRHLGKVALVNHEMESEGYAFSNFMQRLRVSKRITSNFLFYVLNSKIAKSQINYWGLTTSGLVNLNAPVINRFIIPVPPIEDQKKVAKYLDQKVAKIDEAIAKKNQLINLLEEKRTIIINNSVQNAKGTRTKIKHVVEINSTTRKNFKFSDTVSFIPMEAVSENGEINLQERKIQDVISGYTYFEENDVVIAKITPCFENGKAVVMKGLTNGFGFGTTEFIILRSGKRITPEYLYYLIFSRHFRENGINEMRGTAGQKRLTESYVAHYEFNLPRKEDQLKIIQNIKTNLTNIDSAKNKLVESVELLAEYKISLISNAVTGRIKI